MNSCDNIRLDSCEEDLNKYFYTLLKEDISWTKSSQESGMHVCILVGCHDKIMADLLIWFLTNRHLTVLWSTSNKKTVSQIWSAKLPEQPCWINATCCDLIGGCWWTVAYKLLPYSSVELMSETVPYEQILCWPVAVVNVKWESRSSDRAICVKIWHENTQNRECTWKYNMNKNKLTVLEKSWNLTGNNEKCYKKL